MRFSRPNSWTSRKKARRISLTLVIIALALSLVLTKIAFESDATFRSDASIELHPLALLVTTWDSGSGKGSRHEEESLSAVVLNSVNCHIDRLHIVHETTNISCWELMHKVEHKRTRIQHRCSAKLTCEIRHERVTYYHMLHTTKRKIFSNYVTIVANADQVFDETVEQLRYLNSATLTVIATQGLGLQETPSYLVDDYHLLTGAHLYDVFYSKAVDDLVEASGLDVEVHVKNRCRQRTPRFSWDAYAFHPESVRMDKKLFKQRDGDLYMNQLGAENVALRALVHASSRIERVTQSCDFVNLWHFHAHPKTHTGQWAKSPVLRGSLFRKSRVDRKLCEGGFAPCPCSGWEDCISASP